MEMLASDVHPSEQQQQQKPLHSKPQPGDTVEWRKALEHENRRVILDLEVAQKAAATRRKECKRLKELLIEAAVRQAAAEEENEQLQESLQLAHAEALFFREQQQQQRQQQQEQQAAAPPPLKLHPDASVAAPSEDVHVLQCKVRQLQHQLAGRQAQLQHELLQAQREAEMMQQSMKQQIEAAGFEAETLRMQKANVRSRDWWEMHGELVRGAWRIGGGGMRDSWGHTCGVHGGCMGVERWCLAFELFAAKG